jgi:hypothetical protein
LILAATNSIVSFATVSERGAEGLLWAVFFIWGAALCVLVLKNQRKPVLELGDDAIDYRPVGTYRRRHIALSDVAAIDKGRWGSIRLIRRSGRPLTIYLWTIAKDQRQAAREAIERRFAARGA